jgi:hypothetical protein
MAKATSEPVKLKKDDVQRFHALNERRKELEREASNLERECKPLKERIVAFVRQERSESQRAVTKFGFLLELVARAGRVAWKDKFCEFVGSDKALEIEKAAPPTESLSVKALS